MPLDPRTRLRQLIGERIPLNGSDGDTMFTNAEIEDFLEQSTGNLFQAAYVGWQAKAAEYANLASTTEGNSSRLMSDLHAHAMDMVRHYDGLRGGPTAGRTRVGKIRREGSGVV